jgi:hypothetical protein
MDRELMVPTQLTSSSSRRPHPRAHSVAALDRPAGALIACTAALVAVTALAAIAGTLDHALVPSTPPHPTLHPTLAAAAAAAASILANNARVLALPYGLLILRFDAVRWGRTVGSALLVGVLSVNAIAVGLALGRWQQRLAPYLPHLPLEWAATGVSASVWARAVARAGDPGATTQPVCWRWCVLAAAITLLLLTAAAAAEVLLTPHAA